MRSIADVFLPCFATKLKKVGVTYEAYLVKDDDATQYEEFTVSENVEDNEFTFVLKD